MEPIFGFMLFAAEVVVVAVVAGRKGLGWWAYALACIIAAPFVVRLTVATGYSSTAAGAVALALPFVALLLVLARRNSQQRAVQDGSHGDYRKCPFCAEAIRREAIKCKHCGSDLTPQLAESQASHKHPQNGQPI